MNDEKSKQGSFVEHLTELRSRLVKSFIYLFVIFIISYFFSENIYKRTGCELNCHHTDRYLSKSY